MNELSYTSGCVCYTVQYTACTRTCFRSLEEAAYLLRELERLPLVGSASSLQQTAAVRTNPRSSVSAQPSVRSALMDVVNSSPLRSSPLRAMNASPARRQRTSVLMHAADALRVDLSNPNTEVVNSAQKLLMHLN